MAIKSVYGIFSLKLLDSYNIMGLKNNLLLSMNVHCRIIELDLPNKSTTTQPVVSN
jgi:hypothetical protein